MTHKFKRFKRMDKLPSEITDLIMQFAGPRATLSLASTSRSNKAAFNASKKSLAKQFLQHRVIEEKYNTIRELYDSPWWQLLRLDTFFMPSSLALGIGNIELKIEGKINQQEPDRPLLEGAIKVTMSTLLMDSPLHPGDTYKRECFFRRGKINGLSRDDLHITYNDDDYYSFLLHFIDGELNGLQLLQESEGYAYISYFEGDRMLDSLELEDPPEGTIMLLTSSLTDEEIQAELSKIYYLYYDRIAVPEGPFSLPSHNSQGELIKYERFTFRTHGHLIAIEISRRWISISKIYTSYGTDDDESMFGIHDYSHQEFLSFFEVSLPYRFPSPYDEEGSLSCKLEQLQEGSERRNSTEGRYGGEEVQIMPGIRIYFLNAGEHGYLVTAIKVDGFKAVHNFTNPYQSADSDHDQKIRDTFIPVWR